MRPTVGGDQMGWVPKDLLMVSHRMGGLAVRTHIGPSTARFVHFRYPQWFKYFTGVWELLVGVGLLVGLWFPLLAASASVLLSVEMLVAIYSHLVRGKDALPEILPAVVFLLLRLSSWRSIGKASLAF